MKVSLSQLEGTQRDIRKMVVRETAFRHGMQMAVKRSNNLRNRRLYIEEMLVFSQVIEHTIRYLLSGYKTLHKIETRLGLESDDHDLTEVRKIATMDQLIKLLAKEIKSIRGHEKLLTDLSYLNTEYRIKVVHRIFNGEEKSLRKVNINISAYLSTKAPSILEKLFQIENDLMKQVDVIIKKNTEDVRQSLAEQGSAAALSNKQESGS